MNDEERKLIRQSGISSPEFRSTVAKDIGQQLLEARLAAGMTHEQIEALTGYKASKIKAHECYKYPPRTVTELMALAHALRCDVRLVPRCEGDMVQ